MARVELEGVSKVYPGGVRAIESLDLAVNDGELLVLVGPSGSGKTTILRLIAGLDRPTSGDIRIGGRVVTRLPPRERHVAYLPQSCPLYPHLNVYDNIGFGGRMRHAVTFPTRLWRRIVQPAAVTPAWTRPELDRRVREAAGKLDIGHLLERWPRQLSGGERQRVALARAIVREPAAFLFDEPLSSLDTGLRSQLRRELSELQKQLGGTMVYVTHDQTEALNLAQRLVVLERGRVQQTGRPEEIYEQPKNRLVAGFFGSPPMNLLRGEVQNKNGAGCFVGDGWELEIAPQIAAKFTAARPLEAGIRPEGVELLPPGQTGIGHEGEVVYVELVGDVKLVALRPVGVPNGAAIVAKVPASVVAKVGERRAWRTQAAQWHWFDGQSGERTEV